MTTGAPQADNLVHVRFCNVLATQSAAMSNFQIRWYAITP